MTSKALFGVAQPKQKILLLLLKEIPGHEQSRLQSSFKILF